MCLYEGTSQFRNYYNVKNCVTKFIKFHFKLYFFNMYFFGMYFQGLWLFLVSQTINVMVDYDIIFP